MRSFFYRTGCPSKSRCLLKEGFDSADLSFVDFISMGVLTMAGAVVWIRAKLKKKKKTIEEEEAQELLDEEE